MTKTDIERLSVVETKVDDICTRMVSMEAKLDIALATKADKQEVTELKNKVWGMILGVAAFCAITLVGLFIYLLQGHIV